jgi:hypothetical protein
LLTNRQCLYLGQSEVDGKISRDIVPVNIERPSSVIEFRQLSDICCVVKGQIMHTDELPISRQNEVWLGIIRE